MNRAIVLHVWYRYRALWAATAMLILGFVIVFMFAATSMVEQRNLLDALPQWIRRLINALAGSDVASFLTPTGMASFAFTHPTIWVLLVTFAIAIGSGLLAGEVDRGTMDLLATLPVSRSRIYLSMSAAMIAMGIPLCWAVFVGVWVGQRWTGTDGVDLGRLAIVACHLSAAYVFVLSWSLCVSAMCDRRSTAIAVTFGVLFYSFAINLLAAFWEALQSISFTGFLHYYTPIVIVRDGNWQPNDIAVLLGAAAVCCATGLIAFVRRDIRAT